MKNIVIDPRFQLKYTAMLVAVALTISMFLGGFLWRTTNALIAQSDHVVEQSQKVVTASKKVSEMLRIMMAANPDYAAIMGDFDKKAGAGDNQIEGQSLALERDARRLVDGQKQTMYSIMAGLVFLVVLIGAFGIYVTHKIAGPVYKMSMLFGIVGDGKLSLQGRLRKGDELQAFFDRFSRMVDKLRAKRKADLERVEQSIEALRASGANEGAIAGIVSLRDEMKRSLED